jgi:hypothetical protein
VASSARLENNRIFAGFCENNLASATFIGLDAILESGPSELDVHSNHIDGYGAASGTCHGAAIRLQPGSVAPTSASGRFRNNTLRAGLCGTSYLVEETATSADPRELWNNDFTPLDSPTALYRDEGATDLTSLSEIDALTDTSPSGNISADPMWVNYPSDLHIPSGSPCVDAGTATGAPSTDMDGDTRDATPDIGPDEN